MIPTGMSEDYYFYEVVYHCTYCPDHCGRQCLTVQTYVSGVWNMDRDLITITKLLCKHWSSNRHPGSFLRLYIFPTNLRDAQENCH